MSARITTPEPPQMEPDDRHQHKHVTGWEDTVTAVDRITDEMEEDPHYNFNPKWAAQALGVADPAAAAFGRDGYDRPVLYLFTADTGAVPEPFKEETSDPNSVVVDVVRMAPTDRHPVVSPVDQHPNKSDEDADEQDYRIVRVTYEMPA
ncbi:MAG: hypothetical protein ACI9CA_000018 [Natronomonas sp.]|jgi:hypothetical protein